MGLCKAGCNVDVKAKDDLIIRLSVTDRKSSLRSIKNDPVGIGILILYLIINCKLDIL